MKHGILLTAHNNIPVVKIMMQMLDDDRFTFYVLIDKKSNYLPTDFVPELRDAKVNILPSVNISWGGYSQIKAELILIEAALNDGQEYLHFLQGADLPLKTAEQIDTFFRQGGIFMDINSEPDSFAHYKVLCKHFFANHKAFRYNRILKLMNHGIAYLQKPFVKYKKLYGHLYAGSATWSIPADFAEYVLSLKKTILKIYRYSLAADEVFIHTICMNSEYRKKLNPKGGVRLVDWKNREGNSPKTFTMTDADELEMAIVNPNIIFARKFNSSKDMSIVKHISEVVKG